MVTNFCSKLPTVAVTTFHSEPNYLRIYQSDLAKSSAFIAMGADDRTDIRFAVAQGTLHYYSLRGDTACAATS